MDVVLNAIGVMIIMFGIILYLGIDKLFPSRKEQLKQNKSCSNNKSPKQECNSKYNR